MNENFELLDESTVSQPISHLIHSSNYSMLALATENGAILTADPLTLSSSLNLISNHLHTKLIGLDVLCPGTDHCVVSTYLTLYCGISYLIER